MELPLTVYTPESPLGRPGEFVKAMWRDLLASRGLAWRLFVRDISAQYRQSLLGYVWAFLPPLATSLTFVFLSRAKIVSIADPGIPYPAFVVIGTVLWQTFVDAINSPIKMVQNSRAMLAKINFPREALLLAGLAEVLFNFVVRLAIVVAVLVWHQLPVPVTALLAVLGVLALVSFGMMLGILLIPLGMLYSDVGRGLGMITGFWMMLTPVVYPVPSSGLAAVVAGWNPVAPLVTVTRHWLTVGPSSATGPFMAIVLSTVILMLLGWVLYRIAMPHIIARMPN